ncbi:MAG TPA: GtrA family protein, partial [Oscillospiraceae bacterium]|nr:GtrA family protein [Oscillospiraceae bacterium]
MKELFNKYRPMVLFGIIGCGNTLVDWGVYSILYRFTAILWLAQTVGYTAGLVNSYLLNRNLTFRDSR